MKVVTPRTLAIVASGLVMLALGCIGVRRLIWETWHNEKHVELADGSKLYIAESGSQRRYFGHPHVIGFGGGDSTSRLEFSVTGVDYKWEGPFTPLAIQLDDGHPVLIVFDRETDVDHFTFRYFRFSNANWMEFPMSQFPPHLAWQNLWLSHQAGSRDGKEIDDYKVVEERNPASADFQDSFTARIWQCIATGQQYWQIGLVDESFLRGYMAQHVR
jgi:hypothetical protein